MQQSSPPSFIKENALKALIENDEKLKYYAKKMQLLRANIILAGVILAIIVWGSILLASKKSQYEILKIHETGTRITYRKGDVVTTMFPDNSVMEFNLENKKYSRTKGK